VKEVQSTDNHKDNVHFLNIKPKTLHRSYKRHEYLVEFIPKTKKWKWTVTVTHKSVFSEEADTQVKAFRAAEKFIDQNVNIKG
jgi:hypothetical protein